MKYIVLILIFIVPFSSYGVNGAVIVNSAVIASSSSSTNGRSSGDHYYVRSNMNYYFSQLKEDRILESDGVLTAKHKQLGTVEVKSVSGNKVTLVDGRWFYLKSFIAIDSHK